MTVINILVAERIDEKAPQEKLRQLNVESTSHLGHVLLRFEGIVLKVPATRLSQAIANAVNCPIL